MPANPDTIFDKYTLLPSEELGLCFEEQFARAWKTNDAQTKKIRDRIELYAKSLEGITTREARKADEVFESMPDVYEWLVDWWYSKEVLERLCGIAQRFRHVRPILVVINRTPSQEVVFFLREATRCYLYGFFQASVAMTRSALENGLDQSLKGKFGHEADKALRDLKLHKKINAASNYKLLTGPARVCANRVRIDGNQAVHDQPKSESVALERLHDVRKVLNELFRD